MILRELLKFEGEIPMTSAHHAHRRFNLATALLTRGVLEASQK